MLTKSSVKKLVLNWISNILDGVTMIRKCQLSHHLVKTTISPLHSNYVVNAQKGAYADLTDLYKKEGAELYKALDPAYIKGNSINGKIYAVPVAANVASSQNFAFNGTLLAKYGIDISGVTSYETLEPVLKQIKEKAPDVVPFAVTKNFIPSDNFDYPVPNGLPFVIDLEGDTTKIVNRYEVPRFKEHLKTLHKFYEAGYIPKT